MGRTCREERKRQVIRLPHLVVMIRMIEIHGDDATMIVGTVMGVVEAVKVVEAL